MPWQRAAAVAVQEVPPATTANKPPAATAVLEAQGPQGAGSTERQRQQQHVLARPASYKNPLTHLLGTPGRSPAPLVTPELQQGRSSRPPCTSISSQRSGVPQKSTLKHTPNSNSSSKRKSLLGSPWQPATARKKPKFSIKEEPVSTSSRSQGPSALLRQLNAPTPVQHQQEHQQQQGNQPGTQRMEACEYSQQQREVQGAYKRSHPLASLLCSSRPPAAGGAGCTPYKQSGGSNAGPAGTTALTPPTAARMPPRDAATAAEGGAERGGWHLGGVEMAGEAVAGVMQHAAGHILEHPLQSEGMHGVLGGSGMGPPGAAGAQGEELLGVGAGVGAGGAPHSAAAAAAWQTPAPTLRVPGTCARSRAAVGLDWDDTPGHQQRHAAGPSAAAGGGGQGADRAVRETPLEVMSNARQLQRQLLQALPVMNLGEVGCQGGFEVGMGRGRGSRTQGRLSARMQDILARQKQQQQVQQQRCATGAGVDGECRKKCMWCWKSCVFAWVSGMWGVHFLWGLAPSECNSLPSLMPQIECTDGDPQKCPSDLCKTWSAWVVPFL